MHRITSVSVSILRLALGAALVASLHGCTWTRSKLPESMGGFSRECKECLKNCDAASDPAGCRAGCDNICQRK